ncbi:hypothetical protein BC828DRAFT_391393 [Blastocladiella britannica]|nr:hypothetical protein BC828DRAFT_391393 [Blastocladiella britannica]
MMTRRGSAGMSTDDEDMGETEVRRSPRIARNNSRRQRTGSLDKDGANPKPGRRGGVATTAVRVQAQASSTIAAAFEEPVLRAPRSPRLAARTASYSGSHSEAPAPLSPATAAALTDAAGATPAPSKLRNQLQPTPSPISAPQQQQPSSPSPSSASMATVSPRSPAPLRFGAFAHMQPPRFHRPSTSTSTTASGSGPTSMSASSLLPSPKPTMAAVAPPQSLPGVGASSSSPAGSASGGDDEAATLILTPSEGDHDEHHDDDDDEDDQEYDPVRFREYMLRNYPHASAAVTTNDDEEEDVHAFAGNNVADAPDMNLFLASSSDNDQDDDDDEMEDEWDGKLDPADLALLEEENRMLRREKDVPTALLVQQYENARTRTEAARLRRSAAAFVAVTLVMMLTAAAALFLMFVAARRPVSDLLLDGVALKEAMRLRVSAAAYVRNVARALSGSSL